MAGSGSSELREPIFNSENYEFWSKRMKNILKSLGLWEFVEKRFDDPESDKEEASEPKKKEVEGTSSTEKLTMEERLMKDAKALGLIQGVVADEIFP